MMTDPLADMLARIRNAGTAGHEEMRCPASKLKLAVARVLRDEGYLESVELDESGRLPELHMRLRYGPEGRMIIDGLRRVSRPSRRVYVRAAEVPRVRHGMGIAVLSTNKGVVSDRVAREQAVGGELLCEVW